MSVDKSNNRGHYDSKLRIIELKIKFKPIIPIT
jgi:hypothetical protein